MSDMFFFHATAEPAGGVFDRGLAGFHVQAPDGDIGTVADVSYDDGEHYIIVHTGRWIVSKNVLLPAGVVDRIDLDGRRIYVNRTRAEIRDAPEFDERRIRDRAYLESIGWHYRQGEPFGGAAKKAEDRSGAAGQ
jgi:hypothetical protein